MTGPAILSLGSVNADFQVRTPRALRPGETLLASDFSRLGGGKAANVAVLARRLGHPAVLMARLGDDELREQALAPLRRAGVALDGVTVAPGHPTAVSMIAVPPDGKKTVILAPNANDSWDGAAIAAALDAVGKAEAGSVLVADCEVAPEAVSRIVDAARARNLPVVLDPAPADRAGRGLLARCHALTPDAREAGELTGLATDSPEAAAKAAASLARLGVTLVCVKLSDGGCVAAHAGRLIHIPPAEVAVVDTTGAGDAFTGALGVALLERQPTERALLFATAAANLAVTGWGSQEAYPGRDRIEALIPRLAGGMHDLPG